MQLLDSDWSAGSAWHSCICLCVFCLQCAGPASINPRSEIWSAQSVRLIASLTMRGRCTVAVRKTTSVLKGTPPPWPVPVSVLSTFGALWCMRSQRHPDVMQVPSPPQFLMFFRYPTRDALHCGVGGFFSLALKTCNETCLNFALKRCWKPLIWLSLNYNELQWYNSLRCFSHWIIFADYFLWPYSILLCTCLCTIQKAICQKNILPIRTVWI